MSPLQVSHFSLAPVEATPAEVEAAGLALAPPGPKATNQATD